MKTDHAANFDCSTPAPRRGSLLWPLSVHLSVVVQTIAEFDVLRNEPEYHWPGRILWLDYGLGAPSEVRVETLVSEAPDHVAPSK